MSHEPHADDVAPGSTPGEGPSHNRGLEAQRAEGDLPGQPTTDAFREDVDEDGRAHGGRDDDGPSPRVPPEETVPDHVARDAARDVDPAGEPERGRDPVEPEDPMRDGRSAPDVSGVPRHEQ